MINKYENYDTWVNNNGYDGDNSDKYDAWCGVEWWLLCSKILKNEKGNVKGHKKRRKYDT